MKIRKIGNDLLDWISVLVLGRPCAHCGHPHHTLMDPPDIPDPVIPVDGPVCLACHKWIVSVNLICVILQETSRIHREARQGEISG